MVFADSTCSKPGTLSPPPAPAPAPAPPAPPAPPPSPARDAPAAASSLFSRTAAFAASILMMVDALESVRRRGFLRHDAGSPSSMMRMLPDDAWWVNSAGLGVDCQQEWEARDEVCAVAGQRAGCEAVPTRTRESESAPTLDSSPGVPGVLRPDSPDMASNDVKRGSLGDANNSFQRGVDMRRSRSPRPSTFDAPPRATASFQNTSGCDQVWAHPWSTRATRKRYALGGAQVGNRSPATRCSSTVSSSTCAATEQRTRARARSACGPGAWTQAPIRGPPYDGTY